MTDLILSRQLGGIAEIFQKHAPTGLHWDPLSAAQFAAALRLLAEAARRLEADLDRLRWEIGHARDPHRNAPDVMERALAEVERIVTAPTPDERAARQARRDRDRDELVLAGLQSGRVTLFPVVPRPAFGDGHVGAVGDDVSDNGGAA